VGLAEVKRKQTQHSPCNAQLFCPEAASFLPVILQSRWRGTSRAAWAVEQDRLNAKGYRKWCGIKYAFFNQKTEESFSPWAG